MPPLELPPVEEFPLDSDGVVVGAVGALGAGAAVTTTLDAAGAVFAAAFVMAGLVAGFFAFATFLGADLRVAFFATFFRAVFFFAVFRADFFFAADLRVTFRATFFRAIFVLDFTRAFLDFAAFFAERFFFDAFFAAIVMPPDLTRLPRSSWIACGRPGCRAGDHRFEFRVDAGLNTVRPIPASQMRV